jgi:hypothetical protein
VRWGQRHEYLGKEEADRLCFFFVQILKIPAVATGVGLSDGAGKQLIQLPLLP